MSAGAIIVIVIAASGVLMMRFRKRWLATINIAFTNRITSSFAGWLPGFGILTHVGRKSGKVYRTPVNVFRAPTAFIIALTYSSQSEWVKNVLAAGGCELRTRGKKYQLSAPKVMRDPTRRRFLSYFLRVEPSVGRDLIEQRLKKQDSDTLLTEIANVRESPELETIAIKSLSNSDGRIAGNAAEVLQRIGHADVEPLLWQGLEAWHNQWVGRQSSERDFPATAYRDGVVEALLYSHAWVMTIDKLERVHELGMPKDSVLGAVSNFPWWEEPIRVFAYKGPDEFQIKIGYYAYSSIEGAEQHLRMFPGGLHFIWCQQVDPTQEDTLRPVFERLSAIITAQGSTIQVQAQN